MPALNFQKQFAPLVEAGEKVQTIRAHRKDGRMPAKQGDVISLYTGMRTTACRKLMDVECAYVLPVSIYEDHAAVGQGLLVSSESLDDFAKDDGFGGWPEMRDWFQKTHGLPFGGHLIRWKISPNATSENE